MSVLEFDSEWFGVSVGRYDGDPSEADSWAKDNSVGCVFCLLPIEKIASVYDATQRGFRLVGRTHRVRRLRPSLVIPAVREAKPQDEMRSSRSLTAPTGRRASTTTATSTGTGSTRCTPTGR